MLVGNRMSRNPVITRPETTVPKALAVMRGSNVRRLPVVNDKGKLVGIVSLLDLLRASPSPVTSLDQWELHYLLEKLKVDEVMTRDVVTVTEDTPIEEAGRLMVDKKISGLPVLRDGELVGIITESDLFKILLELFGAGQPGVRLTVKMPLVRGGMAKLSTAVAERGGRFVA
ncbi:MAG: hypothetical protein A2W26_12365, partial [Acidobacteria bacterium RBG_16_64_8]